MTTTDYITFILLGVIGLVFLIDFILNSRKNKLATTNEIEKAVDKDNPKKKEYKKPIVIVTATLLLFIGLFFTVNHLKYDGRLTDTDDGVSLLQNITLDKIAYSDIVISNGKWLNKANMEIFSGIIFDSLGNCNGVIINGLERGLSKRWHENGQLSNEKYINKNGETVGFSKRWYKNGQLEHEFNGKVSRAWYENGQLKSKENWKNGYRSGLFRYWHKNGQLRQKGYAKIFFAETDSTRYSCEGPSRWWNEYGQLIEEINYIDGGLGITHERTWHSNGQLKSEVNFKNWKEEGLYRTWHKNGQLEFEAIYINGKMEGAYRTWHENGQLSAKGNIKNDLDDGIYTTWYDSGQLESKVTYKNGKKDGVYTEWNENGQLSIKAYFKNNKRIW